MDSPISSLLFMITTKSREAFSIFIRLAVSSVLLSLFLIIMLDIFHSDFCEGTPNLYLWKCLSSLLVHIVFVIIFPFFSLVFAISYASKYLLYLIVEVVIQKAKSQSIEWVQNHIPVQLSQLLDKISFKIQSTPNTDTNHLVQKLVSMPYNQIIEKFMPSLNLFYVLIFTEVFVFVSIWAVL